MFAKILSCLLCISIFGFIAISPAYAASDWTLSNFERSSQYVFTFHVADLPGGVSGYTCLRDVDSDGGYINACDTGTTVTNGTDATVDYSGVWAGAEIDTLDCSYGRLLMVQIYDGTEHNSTTHFYMSDLPSCGGSGVGIVATPTPTGILGGGFAISIDPTTSANIQASIGSLGTVSLHSIVGLLPAVFGVLAVLIAIGTGISLFKRHSGARA